jgi:hypothetical protein
MRRLKSYFGAVGSTMIVLALACPQSACAQGQPITPTQAGAPSGGKPDASAGKQAASPPSAPATGKPITITVPEAGEHFVRPLPSPDAKQQAQLPLGPFKDKKFTITLDTAVLGKSPRLAVDNAKTGNTAYIPIPPSGSVELHGADFDHIHRVEVKVLYADKPVQVAQVTLTPDDKTTPQMKTIDSASQGTAVFEDVHVGKAKVDIKYGDGFTEAKDVAITTDHTGDKVIVPAVVTNKVATLDTPTAAAPGPSLPGTVPGGVSAPPGTATPAPTPESGGGLAGLVGTLLSLGLVGAGIFLLYKWSQSGGMAATLKKAGIEVSGPAAPSDAGTPWQPNAPAAPVISDPTVCQFCGMKKDPSGACACTLSGAAISTGPSSPAVLTQPRLVATMGVYSGSIFPINPNGTPVTMGREPSNTIPLDNDTTVSRRHAAIRAENGGYVVSDEGSSNGVYVNGVRINGSQPLRPGDEVQVGNTRFRFEL